MEKYVYKITNIVNNKCYIGQSIHPEQRFLEHIRKSSNSNEKIKRAVNKYGKENFILEILYYGENYNQKEKEYIIKFNSIKEGYNIANGGEEPPLHSGETHHKAKLTQKDVDEIVEMLLNHQSFTQILNKFPFISQCQIERINNGKAWHNKNLNYPLTSFCLDVDYNTVKKIIEDIKNTDLSLKEIGKKYNLCKSTIVNINNGYTSYAQMLTDNFPIRKPKNKKSKKYTSKQIIKIKELLLTTDLTFTEIGKLTQTTLSVVSKINSGKTYKQDDIIYPIRKKNT